MISEIHLKGFAGGKNYHSSELIMLSKIHLKWFLVFKNINSSLFHDILEIHLKWFPILSYSWCQNSISYDMLLYKLLHIKQFVSAFVLCTISRFWNGALITNRFNLLSPWQINIQWLTDASEVNICFYNLLKSFWNTIEYRYAWYINHFESSQLYVHCCDQFNFMTF